METIIFLLLILFNGMLLINLLDPARNILDKFSLGFLSYIGIGTFLWFLINVFGIPYTKLSANTIIILSTCILIILNLVYKRFRIVRKYRVNILFSKWEIITISLLLFLFFSSLAYNFYWPVKDWDSLAIYDFRAIIFSQTGYPWQLSNFSYYLQYPFNTSLIHTYLYLNKISNPMPVYSLIYIFFCSSFYFSLRHKINRLHSLFLTFILAVTTVFFDHSTMAYTNLLFSAYYILSFIYLIYWIDRNEKSKFRYFALSVIFLVLSIWTRFNEPLWIANIAVVVVYSLRSKKWLYPLYYALLIILVRQIWLNYINGISPGDFPEQIGSLYQSYWVLLSKVDIARLVDVFVYLSNSISPLLGSLLFVFMLLLYKNRKSLVKNSNLYFLIFFVSNIIVIYSGTLIFSYILPEWKEISNSIYRMTMYLVPFFIFNVAFSLGDAKNIDNIKQ